MEGSPVWGKTALLAAASALAAATGMGVLAARGSELEVELAFGVVRQLFDRAVTNATEEERAELCRERRR